MSTATTAKTLPDPDQHPHAAVVIYDGQCRFCRNQVERLARWDHGDVLAFISAHDPRVARRYPTLSHDQLMDDMYVIDREGEPHRGAAALKFLSRHLRPLWPLAPILHIPGTLPIWQWCYQQIARRRYLWGRADECDSGSCRVHFKASGESERNSRTNSKNEA